MPALRPAGTRAMLSGANWFLWIAGLSLANSLLYLTGQNLFMVMGLASSMYAHAFLQGIGAGLAGRGSALSVALGLLGAVLVTGIFAGLGLAARKRVAWAFIVGMVLYALDAVLMLQLGDYMSAGFHLFALFMIYKGFQAIATVRKSEAALAAQAAAGDPAMAQASPWGAPAAPAAVAVPFAASAEGPRESTAPPAFDVQPPAM